MIVIQKKNIKSLIIIYQNAWVSFTFRARGFFLFVLFFCVQTQKTIRFLCEYSLIPWIQSQKTSFQAIQGPIRLKIHGKFPKTQGFFLFR